MYFFLMRWLKFLVVLAASFGAGTSNTQAVVRTFSSQNGAGLGRFNHMVVHKVTGQIYVGAVNQLYQLTQDLDLIQTELTGPRFESIDCLTTYCPGNPLFYPSHAQNKVLLIDYFNDRLIACDSVYQGTCTLRSLQNISVVAQNVTDPVPVVSNNEEASTVAIIAPGPTNTHVMYVGTTFAGNSGNTSRRARPGIVSRSLDTDRMFQIVNNNVGRDKNTSGTHLFVEKKLEASYIINYVYGFTSEGFSYFLTTQRKTIDETSPYISKLVRICHNDPKYYSYTEIPITCNSNTGKPNKLVQAGFVGKPGSDLAKEMGIGVQDDVLFGVFAKSVNDSNHSNSSSTLCVYSLHSIRHNFMKTTEACFSGNGNRGLDFAHGGIFPCVKTNNSISEDFCGNKENHPLGGEKPIKSKAMLNLDVRATAVVATSTGNHTVVFIGTENGHLKKFVVENSSNASEYEDVTIDEGGTVIAADLLMDLNEERLYVMTERRISKVLQECEVFKTCTECRRDPYCGWCTLEDKCTNLSNCQKAAMGGYFSWVSLRGGRCNGITSAILNSNRNFFDITVETLTEKPLNIHCIFTFPNKIVSREGFIKNGTNQITCLVPDEEKLLCNISGQNKTTAKLVLKDGPQIFLTSVTKNVHFNCKANVQIFECECYQNCTQCTSSGSKCSWYHRDQNCDTIVNQDLNSISDSRFCPRIITVNSSSSEILVATDTLRFIDIPINRTTYAGTRFFNHNSFECSFNIEGTRKTVNAQFSTLNDNIITCNATEFSYTSKLSNINASLTVFWVDHDQIRKPLDNPNNVYVNIYRCRDLASNCGLCLTLNEKYGCGWCKSSNSCEISEQCNQRGSWLDRTYTCPNPKITSFEPKSGPLEGGTNVTIHGINLGKTFDDIKDGVRVAGIPCHPYESLYQPSGQIVCQMDPIKTVDAIVSENMTGPITVHHVQSKDKYQFVDPIIRGIYPRQGPRSGGTILNITGSNMNVGSRIEAFIDELPCRIIYNNTELVQCSTNMSDRRRNVTLTMRFDNGKLRFNGSLYEYVEDPTIQSVESGIQFGQNIKYPKGTPAGGTTIHVVGTNLQYIRHPLIYVVYEDKYYNSSCKVTSNITLECTAPSINHIKGHLTEAFPVQLEYGFIMDDVSSVKNLSSKLKNSYLLYPNPDYNILSTIEIKQDKNESLIFKGQHLDLASQMSDIAVNIGNGSCNITSISRKYITCKPSAEQLLSIKNDVGSTDLPDVNIIVGNNLKFNIKLSYSQPGPTKYGDIHVISILILFIIYILLLAAYRHSSTKNVRVRKIMQRQIDALESRVASECREAFAELQTEITNMAEDLTITGMPFMEYKRYAWMILFPNIGYHRVLQFEPKFKEQELRQFELLLLNKTFLLNFIRTLESSRNFSMSDRVKVASLIMLVLQSKMEYCTDILKTLLAELIKKCVQGKSNPKLLLRRTECVAEKMLSSWFTFLLYRFIREYAGKPLYLLFRAMKQHLDKGPVDAITGEAKYSLSDSKLICTAIKFKSMTVSMSIDCITNAIEVKVLDCDTISQVKEKTLDTLYRATSYSKRPTKIDDYDIKLKCTGAVLSDFDKTTREVGGWKKMNTLKHYKVPDGACLSLVLKYKQSQSTQQLEQGKSSPIKERADFAKKWHIVKRDANDNDQKREENSYKMVSEIYLMRLMATKGTLQKFVDDLFETIFSTELRCSALSSSIKYMFDFLDEQGTKHLTDPDVVHIWKTNALPLRFWVNLIKNPNFVFDIHKSHIVDSCLSVVAQTFIDSCGTSDLKPSKDSSISKLLYAKDITSYKDRVRKYYQHIKDMQSISDKEMSAILEEESQLRRSEFNTNCALYELYTYACKYNNQLKETMIGDKTAQIEFLPFRFQEVHRIMQG